MDFVDFNLAKKLNEKGFSCQYPIAMYNKRGVFHALYSSAGIENYYDYDCFDEYDYVCPTISQVLKWLREEKCLHIEIVYLCSKETLWDFEVAHIGSYDRWWSNGELFNTYEKAAIAGIEYVLDNLI